MRFWPFGPFQNYIQTCDQLVNYMRHHETESYETESDWIIQKEKTVVDGCSLFKILTPFDSATFRDWSHGMLPQLCLSNLEEMNGFSIGSIGSVPCCHIWVFSERNLTELRQTVLQWRSPWWGAALSNGIKLTWISHIRQLPLWHFVSFGVNWY